LVLFCIQNWVQGIGHTQGMVGIFQKMILNHLKMKYKMGIQGKQVEQLETLKYINPLDQVVFDLLEYQEVENYNMRY
jgi:hypothetical protein